MTEDKFNAQLFFIWKRLQTLPVANHEVKAVQDCLELLIRTLSGEELNLEHQVIGGGHILPQGATVQVHRAHERQGIEIAPGVVQYAPPNPQLERPGGVTYQTAPAQTPAQPPIGQPALIDVQAQLGYARGGAGAPAAAAPAPEITPVPGSLMHAAMTGGEVGPGVAQPEQPPAQPQPRPQPRLHPGHPSNPLPVEPVSADRHPYESQIAPENGSGDPVGDAAAAEMDAMLGGDEPVMPGDTQVEVTE